MPDHTEATETSVPGAGPRKVLITGVGRGGTTAIASMLHHAGFNLSGSAEPDSYFEDETLRTLLLDRQYGRVTEELDARVARHGLVAWKDPKLYSDYGRGLMQGLPADWTLIAVFRDPVAIVSRRVSADQVDFPESMERVVRFMRKLQKFVAEVEKVRRVVYVSYEKVMTEPISSIMAVLGMLEMEIDEDRAAQIWVRMRQSRKQYLYAAQARALGGSVSSPTE